MSILTSSLNSFLFLTPTLHIFLCSFFSSLSVSYSRHLFPSISLQFTFTSPKSFSLAFTLVCQNVSVCTVYFIPFFLLNYFLSLSIILYSFFPQIVKPVIICFVFLRPYSNFFREEKVWESFLVFYEFIVKLKMDFSS